MRAHRWIAAYAALSTFPVLLLVALPREGLESGWWTWSAIALFLAVRMWRGSARAWRAAHLLTAAWCVLFPLLGSPSAALACVTAVLVLAAAALCAPAVRAHVRPAPRRPARTTQPA